VGEAWVLPILPNEQRRQRFDTLAEQVRDCRRCSAIVGYRQQTVFGDGNLHPTVCFMGEAPGADEDRTGLPFVGKAGQLLTKIINAMKLRREDVYILNALKCRPPQNRTPINEEIDYCRHFVESQLDILQPQFIVCLGAVAVRSILRQDGSIGRLRGKFHHYRGARVVVTYHPSYLLRNESAKKLVWEDMKMLMAELPQ
jgi:uracil-DNA glycosylase family 4